MQFIIYGAGNFGTAIATLLAQNGYDILLIVRNEGMCDSINNNHINDKYFPDYILPDNIKAILKTQLLDNITDNIMGIINAVPVNAIDFFIKDVMHQINDKYIPVISLCKGVHLRYKMFACDIIGKLDNRDRIVALSGPNYAKEIMDQCYTGITIGSANRYACEQLKECFNCEYTYVTVLPDTLPVELGGAVKNIYALWFGLIDGLGYRENSKALVMTYTVKEIKQIYKRFNCDADHFDNFLGAREYDEMANNRNKTIEGIKTTRVMNELLDGKMKIVNLVDKVLSCGDSDLIEQLVESFFMELI
jgi:glycerol-3-phosphate dehydrogenase (NAD(P)+)